ncbi:MULTISPECIES: hypothetical protein [Corallococcus]|uniref:hypothetical protein n=1 Tax=Corallococcus TaxID=83461 RepID=UPI001F3414B7|nr:MULTISPECIES: hypothetical protein [Corallococcus]
MEDVLEVLNDASKHHAWGTRESNAFEVAAFCLLYVRHIDKRDQLPGRLTLMASPLMEELSVEDEPEE